MKFLIYLLVISVLVIGSSGIGIYLIESPHEDAEITLSIVSAYVAFLLADIFTHHLK